MCVFLRGKLLLVVSSCILSFIFFHLVSSFFCIFSSILFLILFPTLSSVSIPPSPPVSRHTPSKILMLHLSQVSATQKVMVKEDILNMLSVCVHDGFHMARLSQGALLRLFVVTG